MSQWTHVAAVIRFDDIKIVADKTPFAPELGHTCSFEDDPTKWNACDVPCGSEGSLRYYVWNNPDLSDMAAYTVMIWGDLRDYDNSDEIIDYLKRITKGKLIRQGTATIAIEGRKTLTLLYNNGNWETVSVITPT